VMAAFFDAGDGLRSERNSMKSNEILPIITYETMF
jgi:hypothetical protein